MSSSKSAYPRLTQISNYMAFPCFSCNPDAVHEQHRSEFRRRLATLPGKTLQKQYLDLSKMLAHRFFWFLHFPSSKQASKQDTIIQIASCGIIVSHSSLTHPPTQHTCPVLLTQPYATQGFAYANPPYDKLNTKHDVGGFSCGSYGPWRNILEVFTSHLLTKLLL